MALTGATRHTLDSATRSYIEKLERADVRWRRKYQTLEQRYEVLEERHRLLLFKRFARSSEHEPVGRQLLFDEVEQTAEPLAPEQTESTTVTVAGHERKKAGRKPIDPSHPRIEVLHDISDEQKQCGCGDELVRIGEETREIVQVIPEQMWVERHVYPKYGCLQNACEGSGDEDRPAVRIAAHEATILPRSIAGPALIAFILVNKFVDHLPFYRQEKRFARIGIDISRQDMSNWTIAAATRLRPLVEWNSPDFVDTRTACKPTVSRGCLDTTLARKTSWRPTSRGCSLRSALDRRYAASRARASSYSTGVR